MGSTASGHNMKKIVFLALLLAGCEFKSAPTLPIDKNVSILQSTELQNVCASHEMFRSDTLCLCIKRDSNLDKEFCECVEDELKDMIKESGQEFELSEETLLRNLGLPSSYATLTCFDKVPDEVTE